MKNLKPRHTGRPTAEEALRIAAMEAPLLPPAQIMPDDRPTTLNLRLRNSTVLSLAIYAKAHGLTQKQAVCRALAASGVIVAPADLEDRTPRRQY